jgi:hypothetical protein
MPEFARQIAKRNTVFLGAHLHPCRSAAQNHRQRNAKKSRHDKATHPGQQRAPRESAESVYFNFSESCWRVTITRGHQSNEGLCQAKRAQTKRDTLHSQQARGSQSRNWIFDGPRITLKQPTRHRITDSRVADVKQSHTIPPKHAYIRLPQRRAPTLKLSADTRKVNDPKVLLL